MVGAVFIGTPRASSGAGQWQLFRLCGARQWGCPGRVGELDHNPGCDVGPALAGGHQGDPVRHDRGDHPLFDGGGIKAVVGAVVPPHCGSHGLREGAVPGPDTRTLASISNAARVKTPAYHHHPGAGLLKGGRPNR